MTDAEKTYLEKNKVTKDTIYETLTTTKRTYEQKVLDLAHLAENQLNVLKIPERTLHYFSTGAINDLFEGHAPYRPRYVMVDFEKFMKQSSKFLRIEPPKTFDEAIFALMSLYHHIPSITNFPVYLGNLDYLLDPFIKDMSDEEVKTKIKLFLNFLDRTIDDSFCHANIGPKETRMGRLLLEVEATLQNTVPNLTIKYNSKETSDEFMKLAIMTSLKCSNPALCNDDINKEYYDGNYGISSCYNILPLRGGAYTLTRITLTRLADETNNVNEFINVILPECLKCIADYENERIKFFVEKSGYFQSSFLVDEGLIDKDRFVPMFGVTGLAECVNTLLKEKNLQYGRDKEADDLASSIMDKIRDTVTTFKAEYTPLTNNHFMLHAQVGLDSDKGITSGVRIPVGQEPESFGDHLRHSSRYHQYFPAGVGDIFPIASNVEQNPDALLDVVKGAFRIGVHYMSFYSENTDLVRITGYLVKRSEMEKYFKEQAVIKQTTALGAENYKTNTLQNRKVRMG
jgi:YjjI family glycine radical enzyme